MIASAFAVALVLCAGESRELLSNGGFERGLEGWRPLDMSGGTTFDVDTKVKHSGKQSLHIQKQASGKLDFLKQSIDIPVRSGKLAFEIATLGGKEVGARVDAYFFDVAGETLGRGFVTLAKVESGKAFVVSRAEYKIPEKAAGFGINIVVEKPGALWVDSASVTLVGAAKDKPKKRTGGNLLDDGGFETSLDAWTDLPDGSGSSTVTRSTSIKASGSAALQIERKSQRLFPEDGVQARITEPGGGKRFQFSCAARADPEVICCVVAQAFDAKGVSVGVARAQGPGTGSFVNMQCALVLDVPCDHIVVSLASRGRGSAFFDDVVLEAK